MERRDRRDDRRPPRDDNRGHRSRYEQDRSRSPPRRDRRNDRRRDYSPARGGLPSRDRPPSRSDWDRDHTRSRDLDKGPARGRPGDKGLQREPGDHRSNRVSLDPEDSKPHIKSELSGPNTQTADVNEDESSEDEMKRVMGFTDFTSTKNTKVPGNDKNYAIHKVKQAEYRQYMNRAGGFNRPLSPSRT